MHLLIDKRDDSVLSQLVLLDRVFQLLHESDLLLLKVFQSLLQDLGSLIALRNHLDVGFPELDALAFCHFHLYGFVDDGPADIAVLLQDIDCLAITTACQAILFFIGRVLIQKWQLLLLRRTVDTCHLSLRRMELDKRVLIFKERVNGCVHLRLLEEGEHLRRLGT